MSKARIDLASHWSLGRGRSGLTSAQPAGESWPMSLKKLYPSKTSDSVQTTLYLGLVRRPDLLG